MAIMPVEEKVFQLPIDIEAAGKIEKTLKTADTYVDKDIHIEINTPAALFAGEAGDLSTEVSPGEDADAYLTDTSKYSFTIKSDASVEKSDINVTQSGFVTTDDSPIATIAAADANDELEIFLKEGTLEGTNTAEATSETVSLNAGTAESEGFVIKVTADGSVNVKNSGWFDKEDDAAAQDVSDEKYYTLDKVDFTNTETDPDAFKNISDDVPALIEGSYLFLKEGYIKDSKIELAKLVPDGSTLPTTGTESDLMYKTVTAYNNDGKLIAGTMGDAKLGEITADDAAATIENVTVTLSDDKSKFKVTGTGMIFGEASVAIAERGLATTVMEKTGLIHGEAAVDAALNKIALTASVDSSDVVVTPIIEKDSDTTALSLDITTTKPADGKYIAVAVPEDYKYVTATPVVETEGYGIEGEDGASISEALISAGITESGTYYVPIVAGSHEISVGGEETVKAEARVSTEKDLTNPGTFDGDLEKGIVAADVPPTELDNYIVIKTDTDAYDGEFAGSAVCTIIEGYVESEITERSFNGPVSVKVSEAQNLYIKIYDGTIL